ncbi:flagellar motor switch protein FliN/FliY [Quadrisphaera granulorum]|uniref:Flagellar motor switch protein FliN/FliY n=1 Tax=Quadrisphaera granulorum TaxID=317664 RepID=A0A316A3W1_9ACTN|nr:flagellar motor switch protein FliN [Quadrisphaera granulorum]PWJ52581.1 flagellar motor switch protein FliN/FliY [Quadrisphaera granulorum]SZE97631.1 flagellar motor switch protein FliN/FliY [Quadrisphaera granulorum]
MSTATFTPASLEQLTAAANAAAGLLPSPTPLVLGPTDGSLAPAADATGTAVVVPFTGGTSGVVTVIVDGGLQEALASAEGGPLSLAEALAPALDAAVAALGPAVSAPAEILDAADAVARGAETGVVWAPLVGGEGGDVVAWLGLSVSSTSPSAPTATASPLAASLPTQRSGSGMHLLRDVEMVLTVELGRTRMSVKELLALTPGSVIELDRAAGAPADLMVNGRLLARGEVVVVDEDYGLRITEIIQPGAEG